MKTQMNISSLILLVVTTLSTTSNAYKCNASNAKPYPTSVSSCHGDATCLALIGQGEENSNCLIDNSCTVSCDPDTSDCNDLIKFKDRKYFFKRASTFSCTTGTLCYVYDNSYMCVDPVTRDYTDDYGGTGNTITGVYTNARGETQTVPAGGTPTAGTYDVAETSASSSSSSSRHTSSSSSSSGTTTTSEASAEQTGASSRFVSSYGHVGAAIMGVAGMTYLLS